MQFRINKTVPIEYAIPTNPICLATKMATGIKYSSDRHG